MPSSSDPLSRAPLFRDLDPDALGAWRALSQIQLFEAGDVIFREGDPGQELCVVLEGQVRISREVSGVGEEALTLLEPGGSFGEMCMIVEPEEPRSATAVAHEDCSVLVIEKDPFRRLLQEHAELARTVLWNMIQGLSRHLRQTNDKLVFLSSCGRF